MSATRMLIRMVAAITVFLFATACDDDDGDKKPKYEVEIYVSDNIKWEIIEMKPQGRFKKPLIEVHHPEGVDTKHTERKPKKTTVYEFSRTDFALTSLVLALIGGMYLARRRLTYARSFSPSPTYQRA